MTCIIGFADNGTVYIGGDSAGVADYSVTIRADEKVFRKGEFLFGFTSSFRMGQLLRYSFDPPIHHKEIDTYEYMVTSFVDAVRSCLKSGGFAKTDNGEESAGTFLVGYRGRLFMIADDYQVGESVESYAAVGCGAEIAKGALYAASGHPIARIQIALAAAEKFNAGVRGPFVIKEISIQR